MSTYKQSSVSQMWPPQQQWRFCLKLRASTLLSHNPRVVSSSLLFTERWFGMLLKQDHLANKASHVIGGDYAFSTCLGLTDEPVLQMKVKDAPETCADVFKARGFNNKQISQILERIPSLHKTRLDNLQSKLQFFQDLGFTPSGLVQMISCRPRLLRRRINHCPDECVRYLQRLFRSKEAFQKAIFRNPFILTYDLEKMIKPTVELYKSMGITGRDLTIILLSQPSIIPRSSLDAEKLEYIRKMGISKDSKLYKYVVTIMAISRLKTIREKIANLKKFGLLEDEAFKLVGMSPLVLSLSVDKVQRNLTFVVSTMKQPARIVLRCPFLLYNNLEARLKPRMTLAAKIDDMGLCPSVNGPKLFTALRMPEKRFLEVFVDCHPPEIVNELRRCYVDAIDVKRLAEKAKKVRHKVFIF
ncbi:transcription termination factor MTERF15, mitochondrial-like [Bidens hawaiensis]|uniref:transcription termination factor MTERF15, mitochondrial-like n=1 Tax=Bidens hawaiensis TaxID=980011 RepID=UPI00404AAFD3